MSLLKIHPEKMREIVFLLLFGITQHKENDEADLIGLVMHELKVSKSNVRQGLEICHNILTELARIDEKISEVALSFSFDRIQEAERAVLRLCFWELFFQKTTPPHVVLSEAKRLTKKFSEDGAVQFVHALLINACSKQGITL